MISPSSSSNPLHSLLELLQEVLPAAENDSMTTTLVKRLAEWNDQIEPILFGPSSSVLSSKCLSTAYDDDSLNAVSLHLQRLLLTRLLRQLHSESDKEEDGVRDGNSKSSIDLNVLDTQELAATVVAHFRGSDDDARTGYQTAIFTDDSELLQEVLRTCKNWLRWYLQIYIVSTSSTAASTALQQWQSNDMLELYLLLLEQSVPEAPTIARLVSQLFF
jgi:hypothetical protein